jgi:hypothetical protein
LSKIFISHAHGDRSVADDVEAALRAAGLQTWLDVREIAPGDSFLKLMNEGLADSSYVLVLLSSASLRSDWVTKEWMAAMAGRSTVVVPLLLEPVEFPPLLRDIVWIDFRDRQRGLEELLRFFRRELGAIAGGPATREQTRSLQPGAETLTPRELRLIAVACLTAARLDAFLIDAELDPGDIGGFSLNERINSLLHKVRRDGLALSFAEWLALEEPRCFERSLVKVRREQRWPLAPRGRKGAAASNDTAD